MINPRTFIASFFAGTFIAFAAILAQETIQEYLPVDFLLPHSKTALVPDSTWGYVMTTMQMIQTDTEVDILNLGFTANAFAAFELRFAYKDSPNTEGFLGFIFSMLFKIYEDDATRIAAGGTSRFFSRSHAHGPKALIRPSLDVVVSQRLTNRLFAHLATGYMYYEAEIVRSMLPLSLAASYRISDAVLFQAQYQTFFPPADLARSTVTAVAAAQFYFVYLQAGYGWDVSGEDDSGWDNQTHGPFVRAGFVF